MGREGERRTETNERGRWKGKIAEKNRGHEKQSRRRNNSKRVEPKFEKKGKRIRKQMAKKNRERPRGKTSAEERGKAAVAEKGEKKQKIVKSTKSGVKRYLKNTKGTNKKKCKRKGKFKKEGKLQNIGKRMTKWRRWRTKNY